MKTKPSPAEEFHSKLAAYSATATAALLAAPAVADAQDPIYNITSITPVITMSFPYKAAYQKQQFAAGRYTAYYTDLMVHNPALN